MLTGDLNLCSSAFQFFFVTEEERFEMAVLNPSAVFGPILCGGPSTKGKVG